MTAVDNPPTSILPSASFTVTATVANKGTDPAPASTASFYLVNTSTGTKKTSRAVNRPALDPGRARAQATR